MVVEVQIIEKVRSGASTIVDPEGTTMVQAEIECVSSENKSLEGEIGKIWAEMFLMPTRWSKCAIITPYDYGK